jgi:hypothetical protein
MVSYLSTERSITQLMQEISMSGWRAEDLLYLRLGTETPNWCITANGDTLFLASGCNDQGVAVRLCAAQLAEIRVGNDGSVKAAVRLTILGADLRLYLVGKKVDDYMWKGMASCDAAFHYGRRSGTESPSANRPPSLHKVSKTTTDDALLNRRSTVCFSESGTA